jgi:hypothetical protein
MKTAVPVALVGLAISFALPNLAQETNTSNSPAVTATAQQGDTVDPQLAQLIRRLGHCDRRRGRINRNMGCAFQWNGDTKRVEGHCSTVLVHEWCLEDPGKYIR